MANPKKNTLTVVLDSGGNVVITLFDKHRDGHIFTDQLKSLLVGITENKEVTADMSVRDLAMHNHIVVWRVLNFIPVSMEIELTEKMTEHLMLSLV